MWIPLGLGCVLKAWAQHWFMHDQLIGGATHTQKAFQPMMQDAMCSFRNTIRRSLLKSFLKK